MPRGRKPLVRQPAPKVLPPPQAYRLFTELTLGPLFKEAEARFGVRVTPAPVVSSVLLQADPPAVTSLSPELFPFVQSSAVATWMRLAQLLTVAPAGWLSDSLTIYPARLTGLLQFEASTSAERRLIWNLWSLVFCPTNLSSMFHVLTWGFFNEADTGRIRVFELDRVHRGFSDCRFVPARKVNVFARRRQVEGVLDYREGPTFEKEPAASSRTLAQRRAQEEARRVAKASERQAAQERALKAREASQALAEAKAAARRDQQAAQSAKVAERRALADLKKAQKKKAQEDFIKGVVARFHQGQLHREIAEATGVDQPRVCLILNRLGLRRHKSHRFPYRGV